jgi:hypothetical protein
VTGWEVVGALALAVVAVLSLWERLTAKTKLEKALELAEQAKRRQDTQRLLLESRNLEALDKEMARGTRELDTILRMRKTRSSS